MTVYLRFEEGTDIPDSLAHFGVKGMHWGVWNEETRKRHMGGNRTPKVSGRDKLVSEYKSVGYSQSQAERMAKGHDLAKKALIGIGVVAGVAVLATVGIALVNKYGNRTLRSGAIMQTIHKGDIESRLARESFYGSRGKVDNFLYRSRFLDHLAGGRARQAEYSISKIMASKNVKIAGEHTAAMEFKKLCLQDYDNFGKVLLPGMSKKDLSRLSNRGWRKEYASFNQERLLTPNPFRTKYYNHMKAKGFGGVLDMNDSKIAGWTFHPAIVFDSNAFKPVSTRKFDSKDTSALVRGGGAFLERMRYGQNHPIWYSNQVEGQVATVTGAAIAGVYGLHVSDLKSRQNFAKRYREEHPGSKLTDAQLKKMYEKTNGVG